MICDIYQNIKQYSSLKKYLMNIDKSIHNKIYQFITDLIHFGFVEPIVN